MEVFIYFYLSTGKISYGRFFMKTIILAHADCDGLCAAAIAQAKFPDAEVFFTKPVSFLADLKDADADRIIICDIAITRSDAMELVKELHSRAGKSEILYFDHHALPSNIKEGDLKGVKCIRKPDVCTSELIYRHFHGEIPSERVWVALYGAIGDYQDDTPFALEMLADWDKRALYFEVSTLILGIKERQFDSYDAKRLIVKSMANGRNPSDIPGMVESAKVAVTREFEMYDLIKKNAEKRHGIGVITDLPHFGFRGPAALFAATITDSPMGLCICERGKYIDVTARKRKAGISLNKLMETAADAVGGSGGGLQEAAGARIPLGTLDDFLKQVSKLLGK